MAQRDDGWQIGRRIAPPRFVLFAIVFAAGLALAIPALGAGRGTLTAFDIAACVFLAAVAPLLRSGGAAGMRATARANDANRAILLALTGVTMLVILVAVADELRGGGAPDAAALVIATLALAWLFSNTVYALHYAHLFYTDDHGRDSGGLEFPGTSEPDYWDFVYFSFTLGMTFQTSDISITDRGLRRVVVGHCVAAFVFNLGVLAFTINVIGG